MHNTKIFEALQNFVVVQIRMIAYIVKWGKMGSQPSRGKKGPACGVHSNCNEFNMMEEYVRAIIACHFSVCFNPVLQIINFWQIFKENLCKEGSQNS